MDLLSVLGTAQPIALAISKDGTSKKALATAPLWRSCWLSAKRATGYLFRLERTRVTTSSLNLTIDWRRFSAARYEIGRVKIHAPASQQRYAASTRSSGEISTTPASSSSSLWS